MKVLLLESEFAVSQKLAAPIRAKDWQIFFVTDASYALPVALKVRPDVIVINESLIGSALQAITELRTSVHTASVPIITISSAEIEGAQELADAGAQHCFAPPLEVSPIIAKIEELLVKPVEVTQAPDTIIKDPARLESLQKTNLLDSEPEECYDALTALAAKLLDAPTALLSLVDKDRQFFKSQFGLGEPWSSERQTPLTHSFCQWVVSEKKSLIVDDARDHPVLRNNGAVHDLGVVAYAGMPLAIDPDHYVGSFCTIDSSPHQWTPTDLENLSDLSRIINAFVVVHMVRDAQVSSSADISPAKLVQSASDAITGAANILDRGGERLGEPERAQLKELIRGWSEELQAFASLSL